MGDTGFGIAPCNIKAAALHTTHEVTVDGPASQFRITPRTGAVPAAVWGDGNTTQKDPGAVLDDVITGLNRSSRAEIGESP